MVEFFKAHAVAIFSTATPFILWAMNILFQPKARLFRQTRHGFTYLIQEPLRDPAGNVLRPTQTVTTASVSIFNAGRSPATKLEIVFNWKPQYVNIWPTRHYEERLSPDGRYHLFFDSLPAKDVVGFELLNINANLPEITMVRSEQCVATAMQLQPQPVPPKWKVVLAIGLCAIGMATTVYAGLWLLQMLLSSR